MTKYGKKSDVFLGASLAMMSSMETRAIEAYIIAGDFLWALGFMFLSWVQALSGFMIIRSTLKYVWKRPESIESSELAIAVICLPSIAVAWCEVLFYWGRGVV